MAQGTGFGKTILIGDQFVLDEVPAIVSAISYETVTTVERIDGEGWVLEDNRIEVPGYKEKKKEQQTGSINRILEVMNFDVKKNPIKITVGGTLLAGSGVGASAASCVSLAGIEHGIQPGSFDRGDQPGGMAGRIPLSWSCERGG